jgi:hypothetical protein
LQDEVRSRGVDAYQSFGTADLGLIAYETPARKGMVVNEDLIANSESPSGYSHLAGPDEHNLQDGLAKRVAAAGASRRVVFAGQVSGEVKIDLLARADLFVR